MPERADDQLQSLIRGVLNPVPDERLTLDGLMEHAWCDISSLDINLTEVLAELGKSDKEKKTSLMQRYMDVCGERHLLVLAHALQICRKSCGAHGHRIHHEHRIHRPGVCNDGAETRQEEADSDEDQVSVASTGEADNDGDQLDRERERRLGDGEQRSGVDDEKDYTVFQRNEQLRRMKMEALMQSKPQSCVIS